VSQKNVAHYSFDGGKSILIIFGRAAERICYQLVIYYPTSPN